jgi:hypothetical protein
MAVRDGLRVIGLRVEFYKRSAKDPIHARLVMPVLEGQNDTCSAARTNVVLIFMSTITIV